MSTAEKFLKTSFVYMLGSALSRLVGFVLIPLYTTYLSPAEFGYYNLASSIVFIAVPFFSMEIWTGILRFLLETRDPEDRARYANAGYSIALLSIAILTLIFTALHLFFNIELLWYIYFYCIIQCFRLIYESFSRGNDRSTLFAVSGVISSLITIALNIVLIIQYNFGAESLFISLGVGQLVQIIIIEFKVKAIKYLSPKNFSISALKEMVKFSAPMSIGTIFYWFSTGYSAIMISSSLGLAENGIFTVAARFAGVLLLINHVFTLAAQEVLFKADEGRQELYNKSMNYYFKFLSLCTLGLIALTKVIYPFMVNDTFAESLRFIPIYLTASFVNFFAIYLGNYLIKEKRTVQNVLSLLAPCIINVTILHLFINNIGAYAAAYGLFLGYTACTIIRFIQFRAFTKMKFDWLYFIAFAILTAATFVVFFYLEIIWNFAWACTLGLIFIWVFRQYIPQAIATLKSLSRKEENKQ